LDAPPKLLDHSVYLANRRIDRVDRFDAHVIRPGDIGDTSGKKRRGPVL